MIDWDDAFDNSGYVPEAADLLAQWTTAAREFRAMLQAAGRAELAVAYAPQPRNRMDIFQPAGPAKGLFVFIHGGYWQRLDNSYWSHLAQGMLAQGWAVAIPSYTLTPHARIRAITLEIAAAISAAAQRIHGPIRLAGHSAGGHLVTRMACQNSPLTPAIQQRIAKVVSISGIHDLRPLLLTEMNQTLQLTAAEAEAESPALQRALDATAITFWVGAAERPELLRQTRLMAEQWQQQTNNAPAGLTAVKQTNTSGAASVITAQDRSDTGTTAEVSAQKPAGQATLIKDYYEPGQNHFSVISALAQEGSPLLREILD